MFIITGFWGFGVLGFWYGLENSRYKCPNGFEFKNGNYPYWYSNCTLSKVWDPPLVEECVREYYF